MTDELQDLVEGYLQQEDFSLLQVKRGFVAARRPAGAGDFDTWCVWIPQRRWPQASFADMEDALLRESVETKQQFPHAKYYALLTSTAGLSLQFVRELAPSHNLKLRVPVQFFDSRFKQESPEGEIARGAIRELLRTGDRIRAYRVRQPYSVWQDGEYRRQEGDLFDRLFRELKIDLHARNQAHLRIVLGPAGIGKSFLFWELFHTLYDEFQNKKRQHEPFARPIPLTPEVVSSQTGRLDTESLLTRFIDQEAAAPLKLETFKWMLNHGFLTWVFDGFDELYGRDPAFFTEHMMEYLTTPDSLAQILVFARDSLRATADPLIDFLADAPASPDGPVRVFRLEDWGSTSKRKYANLYLDEPKSTEFFQRISQPGPLRSLSGLPFYCALLKDAYVADAPLAGLTNEFDLIERTINRIIEREQKKGLLRLDHFQEGGFWEWLEAVAIDFYETGLTGVDRDEIEEYGRASLVTDLPQPQQDDTVRTLSQFPLFTSGAAPYEVAFKHELLSEYLAGKYLVKNADLAETAEVLSRRSDIEDSLIGKYVAHRLAGREGGLSDLVEILNSRRLTKERYTALLRILLLATPESGIIRDQDLEMENQDLRGVHFKERDLKEVSFRGSNLSRTCFDKCVLDEALFEGAVLYETRFSPPSISLEGAQFGDLERFGSIWVGSRRIDDHHRALEWIEEATGIRREIDDPCPASYQMQTLFLKFVNLDGSPRRFKHHEDTLKRGKRYEGAPTPDECIEAALKAGYLSEVGGHHIRRPHGTLYGELCSFVTEWEMTPGLRKMLDDLCDPECQHVPPGFGTAST